MSFMVKHYSSEFQGEWILDTGATGHMYTDQRSFVSLKRLTKLKKINMANGSEEDAYREGTITINPLMTLEGVLYVPGLAVNLCSLKKFDEDSYIAIIGYGKIAIYEDNILVITGNGKDLYRMDKEVRAYSTLAAE